MPDTDTGVRSPIATLKNYFPDLTNAELRELSSEERGELARQVQALG